MNEGKAIPNADLAGLAAAVNSRLGSNARVARAKGFAWLCGGLAMAVFLGGVGAALAFIGYSHLISIKPATEKIAQGLVSALEHADVHATVTGTMSLAPNSEIKLAAGQTVKLEDRSPLKLDPNSSVQVIANVRLDTPQPSKEQLQVDLRSKTGDLPFTEYMIFRSVKYGQGVVETGWGFELSDPTRPKAQLCSYREYLAKGKHIRFVLALNGAPLKSSSATIPSSNFDFDAAVSNCIWFSGM